MQEHTLHTVAKKRRDTLLSIYLIHNSGSRNYVALTLTWKLPRLQTEKHLAFS